MGYCANRVHTDWCCRKHAVLTMRDRQVNLATVTCARHRQSLERVDTLCFGEIGYKHYHLNNETGPILELLQYIRTSCALNLFHDCGLNLFQFARIQQLVLSGVQQRA